MLRLGTTRITPGMAVRMLADVIMVQAALILALLIRLYIIVAFDPEYVATHTLSPVFRSYLVYYLNASWPISLVCLFTFYITGFYTYGRYYQGRYKLLVVTQAVCLAYLAYGSLSFFFGGQISFPRVALVLAWLFTILMVGGSRVWSQIWDQYVHPERSQRQTHKAEGERRVLVIGGGGYIGSALLKHLLDDGWHVRLLDLMIFGDAPLAEVHDHPRLEVIHGDFRHVEMVARSMQDVDAVVHLGAIVGDPACSLDEDLTIEVNLSATRMIAELAKTSGVERFVFASTCSVYGASDETMDEHTQPKPVSLYAHTKLAAEKLLLGMADANFAPTILRFSTIYGLSGRTRFDLVVNLLAAKAKLEGEITIHGGRQWRPFVHVDDAARSVAIMLSAPTGLVGGEIFNVGSDEQNYTIEQIGEIVHEQVVGATIITSEDNVDLRNYRVSFHKIRTLLDYTPNWTVEQGIHQVLEAIASGEVTDYQDHRYSNVKFLEQESGPLVREDWAREMIRHAAGE